MVYLPLKSHHNPPQTRLLPPPPPPPHTHTHTPPADKHRVILKGAYPDYINATFANVSLSPSVDLSCSENSFDCHLCGLLLSSGLQTTQGLYRKPGAPDQHLLRLLEDDLRQEVCSHRDALPPAGEGRGGAMNGLGGVMIFIARAGHLCDGGFLA